jgi:hypothetical protein
MQCHFNHCKIVSIPLNLWVLFNNVGGFGDCPSPTPRKDMLGEGVSVVFFIFFQQKNQTAIPYD